MRWLDGLVLFYGIILIAGAFYAYHASKSMISLVAGGTCGILEIGLAALARTNPRVGRIGSAVVALLVLGQMGPGALKTGRLSFTILAVASVVVIVCLLGGHFYAMSQKKKSTASAS